MSYNSEVKAYLSKSKEGPETTESELYGLLQGGISYIFRGRGQILLKFETEHASVARRFYSLCKEVFSVTPEIRRIVKNQFGENHSYSVEISEYADCLEILRYFNIADMSDGFTLQWKIDFDLIQLEEQKRAYLRGVFLACGYLADPKKSYLIEFHAKNHDYAESLREFIAMFEIGANIREKNNEYLLYIKRAEDISTILALCGAYDTVLMLQDKMAHKEMKNKLQRVVNCDTANMNKTIEVSLIQQRAIEKIIRTKGLSSLPEFLVEAAQLRMEYPESSLSEMAALCDPPLSRSTLDKRLKKIVRIAEDI